MEFRKPQNIIGLLTNQVTITPDHLALVWKDKYLTYRELDEKSNKIANYLVGKGVKKDDLVPICLNRSIEMIIGIIGILKSGAAYVPVDPEYPAVRISYILKNIASQVIVTDPVGRERFDALESPQVVVDLERDWPLIAQQPEDAPAVSVGGSSIVYILFTSGSTGEPKGVCMPHQALFNLMLWQERQSVSSPGINTIQFSKFTFDVSFQEIFSTLTTGGTLFLVEEKTVKDPDLLLRFIHNHAIHRLFLPFVSLQSLAIAADLLQLFPPSLQEVITAGEQLKITEQLFNLFSNLPGSKLFNQYGPTETHVVTQLVLNPEEIHAWPPLPSIGFPIDHTEILILDEQGEPVLNGVEGEICIAGICLANGYLNNEALTNEKFVLNSSSEAFDKKRIYKTGDIGKIVENGEVIFLGRKDDQVKIRGHRVELGEIETVLTKLPGVHQVAVVAKTYNDGQKFLALYYQADSAVNQHVIKAYLAEKLPEYMIPSVFMKVDQFPKTSSGKIDRKSLPDPLNKRSALGSLVEKPKSPAEVELVTIVARLLNFDRIGINDNFFELGGNSLLAQKLVSEIKAQWGKVLSVTKIYQYPEIKRMAQLLIPADLTDLAQKEDEQAKPSATSSKAVAIIGLAGRFPGSDDIDSFWDNLISEKESISIFDPSELDSSIPDAVRKDPNFVAARGILRDADHFDCQFFGINPAHAELMDPQQRVFLEISWEVLEKARITTNGKRNRIGVFAGTNNNTYFQNNIIFNEELMDRYGAVQIMSLNEKDYVATRTAYQFDLNGPAISLYSACSTSLLAVAQAAQNIRAGQCDMALAGGCSITSPIKSGHVYQEGAIFSADAHCRPFDAEASGTLFCDGAGVVLLKDFDKAVADGDTIYAKIIGIGVNNDGSKKGSFSAPSAEGQAEVIRKALTDAEVSPSAISYIEAHGTATPLGDPIEIEGLKMAFGQQQQSGFCAIGSVKSNIGHLTAAAGIAGMIKTVLSLHHHTIPASLGFKELNPVIDLTESPFYVQQKTGYWKWEFPRKAGVSSFGIGGTNVHVILEEYINEEVLSEDYPMIPQLLAFSAKSEASLSLYAHKLHAWLDRKADTNLADLAFTINTKNFDFPNRAYLPFSNVENLKGLVSNHPIPTLLQGQVKSKPDQLIFLFPGQGSQYLNMGKCLYETNTVFKNALHACTRLFDLYLDIPLIAVIYPSHAGEGEDAVLKDTKYTQPAIFAIEYALASLWMSWGIQPTGFCGHSIGEYVAAHLSGAITLEEATRLVAYRGKLVSELPKGEMLSVRTSADRAEEMLTGELSIAAINSPNLCVVAGSAEDIQSYTMALEKEGILYRKLLTSHAFHSSMMDPILDPFKSEVEKINFKAPAIPIYSTVTGKILEEAESVNPAYWTEHLRKTVRFSDAISFIARQHGDVVFLEVGAGNGLSTLIKQHPSARQAKVANSLHRQEGGSEYEYLISQLGQLYIAGIDPDWDKFYSGQTRKILEVPTYAFDKKKCWIDPLPRKRKTEDIQPSREASADPSLSIPKKDFVLDRKEALLDTLFEIIEEASGVEIRRLPQQTTFLEMGLDSLLLTQLALIIKRKFEVPLGFKQLNNDFNTPIALVAYIDSLLSADKFQPEAEQNVPKKPQSNAVETAGSFDQSTLERLQQQLDILIHEVSLLKNQKTEILTGSDGLQSQNEAVLDQTECFPPVPGARLGRDPQGNPAWFLPDITRPGKYLKIGFGNN